MKECLFCGIEIDDGVYQCGYCKSNVVEKKDVAFKNKTVKSSVLRKAKSNKSTKSKLIKSNIYISPPKVIIRSRESCIICATPCSGGNILSNGSVYHKSCWKRLKENLDKEKRKLSENQTELDRLSREVKKGKSVLGRIKHFLSGYQFDIEAQLIRIQDFKEEVTASEREINNINRKLTKLYDYWPDYPPDWEERKQKALIRSLICEKCGSSNRMLHVHHKQSISRGGSHLLENLELLCEKCHSKKHGNKNFDYSDKGNRGSFQKKLSLINNAISNKKIIHFSYKNLNDHKSVRSIKPQYLKQIENTLCVDGFCYLRHENRTFAIKRMTRIKIINQPRKSYFK